MQDDQMSDEKMSDEKMSDEKMSDEKMSDEAALPSGAKVLDSRPGALGRRFGRPSFWVVAVLLVGLAPVAGALSRTVPPPPGVYAQLPRFTMTNVYGAKFGSDELDHHVWVASFAFTSCPSVCPALMKRLQVVQHRTRNAGSAVRIVTFSVDPENDTPEKLRAYAKRFKASPYRWAFLTGDLSIIEKTVVGGFKLAMGKDADNLFEIFHSERFALVDRSGRIRGYYEATDEGIDKLVRDIGLVLNFG
jgi:protein SCO1/2